jgi:hypothetical protein
MSLRRKAVPRSEACRVVDSLPPFGEADRRVWSDRSLDPRPLIGGIHAVEKGHVIKRGLQIIVAVATATAFLLSACSHASQTVSLHMAGTQAEPEHDEVESPDYVAEYYPNRTSPSEVVFRYKKGGMADITCINRVGTACTQFKVKITGTPQIPEGTYQFVLSDDPKIMVVKNEDGTQTVGYLSSNWNGHSGYYKTLQEAEAHEHEGDAWRTAGKVALYTLLIVAVVGIVAVAAASGSAAPLPSQTPVTTTPAVRSGTRRHAPVDDEEQRRLRGRSSTILGHCAAGAG